MRTRFLPILLLLVSLLGCGGRADADKAYPLIYDFRPGRANITPGTSTLLLANFVGGTATIDQGIGPITSGVPITVSPSATTTYTLTVKATTGDPAVATTAISVGPMGVDITPAQASLVAGQTQAFTATVTGLADTRVTWVAEGGGSIDNQGLFTAGGIPGAYRVSAQSVAEPTLCAKAFVTILAAPIVVNVNPPAPAVSVGHQQTFTAQVTGSTNGAVTWSTSAGSITAGGVFTAPATAGSVTVTATSVADPTKAASAAVNVVDLPVITAFSLVDIGSSAPDWVLNATFSGGTGTVDQGVGAITSGGQVNLGITHSDIYTLTVTNPAGDSVTRTASAIVIQIESSNPASLLPGRTMSTLWSVFNATNTAVTFSASAGSVTSGGVYTPPMVVGVYTVTVTSVADPTVSAVITVNVQPLLYPQNQFVGPGASYTFHAALLGLANPAVTWSVSGGGSVDPVTGVFTADTTTTTITPVVLTATSVSNPAIQATANISLNTGYTFGGTATPNSTPMATPRAQHAIVRDYNDDVIITGGTTTASPTGINGIEIYRLFGGDYFSTPGGLLGTARSRHTATLLPTGLILIAGGRGASGAPLNSAELYDPLYDTVTPTAGAMTAAREDHEAVLLPNGKVLFAGGRGAAGLPLASLELYDPATNTFAAVPGAMGDPRLNFTAQSLLNGKVLLVGGSKDGTDTNLSIKADLFDPATGTVSPLATTLPIGAWRAGSVTAPNGLVGMLGGVFNPSVALVRSNGDTFTPGTGAFASTGGAMNGGRNRPLTLMLSDGRAFVLGGTSDLGLATPLTSFDFWNPATTGFSASPTASNGGWVAGVNGRAVLLYDGSVLVCGDARNVFGGQVASERYQ